MGLADLGREIDCSSVCVRIFRAFVGISSVLGDRFAQGKEAVQVLLLRIVSQIRTSNIKSPSFQGLSYMQEKRVLSMFSRRISVF